MPGNDLKTRSSLLILLLLNNIKTKNYAYTAKNKKKSEIEKNQQIMAKIAIFKKRVFVLCIDHCRKREEIFSSMFIYIPSFFQLSSTLFHLHSHIAMLSNIIQKLFFVCVLEKKLFSSTICNSSKISLWQRALNIYCSATCVFLYNIGWNTIYNCQSYVTQILSSQPFVEWKLIVAISFS